MAEPDVASAGDKALGSDSHVEKPMESSAAADKVENSNEPSTKADTEEPNKNGDAVGKPESVTKENGHKPDQNEDAEKSKADNTSSPDRKRSHANSNKHDSRDWRERRDTDKDSRRRRRSRSSTPPDGHRYPRNKRPVQKNIRSTYNDMEETDDPAAIRQQVEFYFSESNLPADKFLLTQTGYPDENNFISVSLIANFNRMKHFRPYTAVVKALKDSEMLEVKDSSPPGNEGVRRRVPLPADKYTRYADKNERIIASERTSRTVCASGFGHESSGTQLAIEAIFAPYDPVAVRLDRTYPERTFKGNAFVEFKTVEEAMEFLDLSSKPTLDDGEDGKESKELKWYSKTAFNEKSASDLRDRRENRSGRGGNDRDSRGGKRGRGRGRGGKGRSRDGDNKYSRRSRRRDDDSDDSDSDDSEDDRKKHRSSKRNGRARSESVDADEQEEKKGASEKRKRTATDEGDDTTEPKRKKADQVDDANDED